MIKRTIKIALGATLVAVVAMAAYAQDPADYAGSEFCANCHADQYNKWVVSGHPYKLTEGEIAKNRPIPLPEGYSWDDISYVIGGYKWKSRYVGTDGYIITSVITDDGVVDGMNQYNNLTGEWVDYHPGEMKPYDCGRCHTTGFSEDGHQGGLPGIDGTWVFGGIQCEECHGPFVDFDYHFSTGPIVDHTSEACGQCHVRGDTDTIPASGGFIRHHEQYNEQLASPHKDLDCDDCHDPHVKSEFSIHTTCEDCHANYADTYAGTTMDVRGVDCIDCHMPFAAKSAAALGPNKGDIRSHLFRINTERGAEMFTPDGKFVLLDAYDQGALTLDFACQVCHTDKSMSWIEGKAKNFHGRGHQQPHSNGIREATVITGSPNVLELGTR